MLEKLKAVEKRFEELTASLGDPGVISNRDKYRACMKEHAELEPLVKTFQAWTKAAEELKGSKQILDESKDDEMRELALLEVQELKAEKERLHKELLLLLLPKDPNDDKNIIIEIRLIFFRCTLVLRNRNAGKWK
jgi:peptide chain release factor 1